MKWLRENAAVLTLAGAFFVYVAAGFLDYGPLIKKDEVYEIETEIESEILKVNRVLSNSLLKLAECVDNPEYEPDSDQAKRNPSCQQASP